MKGRKMWNFFLVQFSTSVCPLILQVQQYSCSPYWDILSAKSESIAGVVYIFFWNICNYKSAGVIFLIQLKLYQQTLSTYYAKYSRPLCISVESTLRGFILFKLLGRNKIECSFSTEPKLDIIMNTELPCINADKIKFKQILYNLVGNAIKFTPEGYVAINAQCIDNMLVISVTDTGIGIPSKDLDKLFQPFKQLSPYLVREYKGAGLDWYSPKVCWAPWGTIWVKSEVGNGSTFTFTIPYWPEEWITGNRYLSMDD